jgi:NAD(P)-dependent dehydrogenase (short-subunit alcohol dehydrogenase family)
MMTNRKVAFITGANRGIGLETARELGEIGVAAVAKITNRRSSTMIPAIRGGSTL